MPLFYCQLKQLLPTLAFYAVGYLGIAVPFPVGSGYFAATHKIFPLFFKLERVYLGLSRVIPATLPTTQVNLLS